MLRSRGRTLRSRGPPLEQYIRNAAKPGAPANQSLLVCEDWAKRELGRHMLRLKAPPPLLRPPFCPLSPPFHPFFSAM